MHCWVRRSKIHLVLSKVAREASLSHSNRSGTEAWFGKWALVTGASAGIGVALAEELAEGGTNLLLTARRKDRLEALAQRLTATHEIKTQVFSADLADPAAPEKIFAFTHDKGIAIDLLINNAGFGKY